jgi:DNA polymerase-3 subunit epsilon
MADDEEIARALEATGNFRVLRRIRPTLSLCEPPTGERTFVGVVLDVETTGLDTANAEVIELGMIKFEYGRDGTVYRVTGTFSRLRQPSTPIPPEITRLTGISDADVEGRSISVEDIQAFVAGAGIVIAHNAKFDRPICERQWPLFREMNWACSMEQIPWRDEALDAQKLGYILKQYGLFHTEGSRRERLAYISRREDDLTSCCPPFAGLSQSADGDLHKSQADCALVPHG